jgi:hypothetical protein
VIKNKSLLDEESIKVAVPFAEAIVRQSEKQAGDWSPIKHVAETMLALNRFREQRLAEEIEGLRRKTKKTSND